MLKKTHFALFCFFALIFGAKPLAAQKRVWLNFAEEAQLEKDWFSAVQFYHKALNFDTTDVAIHYNLARCYLAYYQLDSANYFFKKVQKNTLASSYPETDFYLAKVLKLQGNYQQAHQQFEYFRRNYKGSAQDLRAETLNEIKNYPKLKQLLQDTVEFYFWGLKGEINTPSAEFSLSFFNDSIMYYAALKAPKLEQDGWVDRSTPYHAALFKAVKNDSTWKQSEKIKLTLPKHGDVANPFWNKADSTLYFTFCTDGYCGIWRTQLVNKKWTTPSALSINETESNSTHAVVSKHRGRKVLLFSSDRRGSRGGMDLWISYFNNNDWQNPQNLGPLVNTPGNEITPFLDTLQQRLYFSSDWHYNLGGFDVFVSDFKGLRPLVPKNLGYPINTSRNELYWMLKDSVNGFYTSNRTEALRTKKEVCCNDIFEFAFTLPKDSVVIEDSLFVDTLFLVEQRLKRLLKDIPVKLYFHNDIPNPRSLDTLTALNYWSTYEDYIQLKNDYLKEYPLSLPSEKQSKAKALVDSFFVNHVQKGAEDLVYFADTLHRILALGYSVKITAKGFASPLAHKEYNFNLSKRRISSFKNYLINLPNTNYKAYIDGTHPSGVRLYIETLPSGEDKSNPFVSDDYYDVRNSIYNPAAAYERRVEVVDMFVVDTPHIFWTD